MRVKMIISLCVTVFFFSGVIFGCASIANETSGLFPESNAKVKCELPPEAEITKAEYYMDEWKGEERLHFEIEVKNTNKEQHRYRVRIIVDDHKGGPATAGLFPRKIKNDEAIQPGETHKRVLPMRYDKEPEQILILVNTFDAW